MVTKGKREGEAHMEGEQPFLPLPRLSWGVARTLREPGWEKA